MCDGASPSAAGAGRRAVVPNMCVKCKTAPPSIAIRRILYCKACFVRASVAKFRTAHTKSLKGAPRPRPRAMVALSGGAASSALLRLAADHQAMARKGTEAAPPYAGITVGHIDESALFPGAPESEIRAAAAASGLPCVWAALEDAFAPGEGRAALLELAQATPQAGILARLARAPDGASGRAQLAALFAGLGSATDREDMLQMLKTALIVDMARRSGCGVVLVGDSATRIAVRAMSLTSRGRGFSLPLDVGAEMRWFDGVDVYRPMRDFVAKEIAFFNRWTGQPSAAVPTFTTGQPRSASIDRLSEAFIVELDQGFASTVPTVCRTLQKLEPCAEARAARPCAACGMPADIDGCETPADIDGCETPADIGDCGAPADIDVSAALCYSCRGLLRRAAPGTALPQFCLARLEAADAGARRAALRRQIDAFLIGE
ncbi:Cytoplasmic tRNA 2-thiolation protein 2 [Coemansia javaensis]|uniref:Cytoplasmic tRNA 2-thiolation protein 2 n=1 Tax=Coemansia javaensis TaxID=2761396 RepID=A0A9W8LDA4_9FUNG|nr:Cytoplasmic tRNA 2-thiolation protein 2 [Coemansia javaensis]